MSRRGFTALLTAVALGTAAGYSIHRARAAGIPSGAALTYAGVLTDSGGVPLTGSKNIQISLHDMAAAGSQLCSVGPVPVALVNGEFQLGLPESCSSAVHANPDLWIEVFVDGASLGRTKLGAVPYALEADHAVTADSAASAAAVSAAALRVAPGACSYTTGAGATDCSCAAGEVVVGGGTCVGQNCNNAGISLVESRPLTATTWRLSCENENGSRVQCPGPTISCLKTP